jgi:leucyl-tRNA synthetase
MAYGADLSSVIDFREAEAFSLKNKLLQFYSLIANEKSSAYGIDNATKWLLSRFNKNIKAATEAIENYAPRHYTQIAFFNISNDIAYFKKRSKNLGILREKVFPKWIRMLSPVMPHICEELWKNLGNKSILSLERWPEWDEKEINDNSEIGENLIKKLTGDIHEILKLVGKKPKKIKLFLAEDWKYKLFKVLKDKSNSSIQSIIKSAMDTPEIKIHGKEATNLINKIVKNKGKIKIEVLKKDKEAAIIDESREFLEREFGCDIEIIDSKNSKEIKSKQSIPNKPAILVET